jgi:hypothetical protein
VTGSRNDLPSKTIDRLRTDLSVREVLGTLKYGTTVDRVDLNLMDWIRHAREEAMDLSVYLTRILILLEEQAQEQES